MDDKLKSTDLKNAAEAFLLSLPAKERGVGRQEVHKFVSWFGAHHPVSGLTGAEVANYAERLSQSHADAAAKLEPVRTFLVFARKNAWTKNNLAANLNVRKTGRARTVSARIIKEPSDAVQITQQGMDDLKAELEELIAKRPGLIDEIQRAAADKDFRENVPLHAAREARGHLEGRIMELELMLKSAVVIGEQSKSARRVSVGDTVVLRNLESDVERRYTLVSPREVDAARGRISSVSPIGQAVVNRKQGDTVEVLAPAGRMLYQIKQVER